MPPQSDKKPRMHIKDQADGWEVTLEDGGFTFHACGKSRRLRNASRRAMGKAIKCAYREWEQWRQRTGQPGALAVLDVIGEATDSAETGPFVPTIEQIIGVVASRYGLKPADLLSEDRSQPTVTARQLAMRLCRELTGHTLVHIGDAFGGKSHTTVIHACRVTGDMMVNDLKESLTQAPSN